MPLLPPLPRNSLLAFQQQLYYRFRPLRDQLVQPIILFYVCFGLTPNTISLLGVAAMLAFILVVPYSPPLALCLLILNLIFDTTDGALARHLRLDSDRGKLTDIISDIVSSVFLAIGLALGQLISLPAAVLLGGLTIINRSLRVLRHSRLLPTDWRFRPVAGFIPVCTAYVLYIAFAVAALATRNYLPAVVTIVTGILAIDSLITLFLLHHKKYLLTN